METPAVINAIVTQLQQALPELATQFMPFCPPTFAPDEPRDTVVLSYPGSDFTPPQSTDVGVQIQTLHILATVITPEAHSPLNPLDRVRQALGGIALAEGECPLWLVGETCDGASNGFWRYTLELAIRTVFIPCQEGKDLPVLTQVNYEEMQ